MDDDCTLVERAQAGDVAAQEDLVRRHRDSAFSTALQLTGNREDALDLAQEAMFRFVRTLGRFDGRRPVRPWLYQIVRNLSRDARRRRVVRRADSLDTLIADGAYQPVDKNPSPETLTVRRDLQRKLAAAVGRLSDKHREIVVLRDYQDLSYAEISEVLGIPQGTVMSRLHAARSQLREALRGSGRSLPQPSTEGEHGTPV